MQASRGCGLGHPPGSCYPTPSCRAEDRAGIAYGNFNITQIKLEIPDGSGWKAVAIQKIAADTGARSLDRKRGQVWTVDASREDQRLPRQLVIVPENPMPAREVRITIVQESEFSCQSVGCFRLSATDDSNPATVVDVSHSLRALLGKTGRTEDQEKKLSDYFLTVAPSLQSARDELKQAKEDEEEARHHQHVRHARAAHL